MFFVSDDMIVKAVPATLFTVGILLSLDSLVLGMYSITTSFVVKFSFSLEVHGSYISALIRYFPAFIPLMPKICGNSKLSFSNAL